MKKKFFIVISMLMVLAALCVISNGFPIIINNNKEVFPDIMEDSIVNPLGGLDLANGNNEIILIFNDNDWLYLPNSIPKRKVLTCSNNEILRIIQNKFEFRRLNADISTVSSEIIVVNNNHIVLKTGFAIDSDKVVIQNEKTGCLCSLRPYELCELFSSFQPCDKVVLLINNIQPFN